MLERFVREIKSLCKGPEPIDIVTSLDLYFGDRESSCESVGLNSRNGWKSVSFDYLSWNPEEKRWKKFTTIRSTEMGGEDDTATVEVYSDLDRDIADVFLIHGELQDLLYQSPKELIAYVRENIPEETLILRAEQELLKRKKEHQHREKINYIVSGWGK